jgi:hypothetical protein
MSFFKQNVTVPNLLEVTPEHWEKALEEWAGNNQIEDASIWEQLSFISCSCPINQALRPYINLEKFEVRGGGKVATPQNKLILSVIDMTNKLINNYDNFVIYKLGEKPTDSSFVALVLPKGN